MEFINNASTNIRQVINLGVISIIFVSLFVLCVWGILKVKIKGQSSWSMLYEGTGFYSIQVQLLMALLLTIGSVLVCLLTGIIYF